MFDAKSHDAVEEIDQSTEVKWSSAPRGSTFSPTFWLLHRALRADICRLYGALRSLDDSVDERRPDASARIAEVEAWCNGAKALGSEARVFQDLAVRRGIRREPVADFCMAMRHDIECDSIGTEDELEIYCRRVSGAAGVLIAQLVGAESDHAERLMSSLGIGVQLTHILRDIDFDRSDGRTYIPRESIERFGSIDPGKREALLRHFIAHADRWFDEAAAVVPLLPEGRRWVVASSGLYREILRQIEREGYGRNPGRVEIPRRRRHAILARACLAGR